MTITTIGKLVGIAVGAVAAAVLGLLALDAADSDGDLYAPMGDSFGPFADSDPRVDPRYDYLD